MLEAAERVLQERVSLGVRLSKPEVVAERDRSLVVRLAAEGLQDLGSVVVKRNWGDDERGFTDWASLEFLSGLEGAVEIAPRFYGGDPSGRFFVMEDLGESRNLEDVLEGRGGPATEAAVIGHLRAMAVPMARLVAATLGKEETFRGLRTALPGSEGLGRRPEAERWLGARERFKRWSRELGPPPPSGFDAALRFVAGAYTEPGEYLTFSHGDPAPSNNHLAGSKVRLVDFEYAAYRHALYDITAWYVLCPLPEAWIRETEIAFRQTLSETRVKALVEDDDRYRLEWAKMCAYRALAMLTWFPEDLLERDREWTPGWTGREAMISTALRLHHATASIPALASLSVFGAGIADVLQARWPELGDGSLRWRGVVAPPRHR